MARTQKKPGPKPRFGARRDYHILLSAERASGEKMALADAFEEVAKAHGGIIAYVELVLRQRPEIQEKLTGHIPT